MPTIIVSVFGFGAVATEGLISYGRPLRFWRLAGVWAVGLAAWIVAVQLVHLAGFDKPNDPSKYSCADVLGPDKCRMGERRPQTVAPKGGWSR